MCRIRYGFGGLQSETRFGGFTDQLIHIEFPQRVGLATEHPVGFGGFEGVEIGAVGTRGAGGGVQRKVFLDDWNTR